METKNEIPIIVPKGMMIGEENSTFECIKLKPKGLTYKDVAKKLFSDKATHFINTTGEIITTFDLSVYNYTNGNNATSKKQLEKLLAINKLMNEPNISMVIGSLIGIIC